MIKIYESSAGYSIRKLPKGCKQCVKGRKAVIFITGICNRPPECRWYCPISKNRQNKDLIFVNERPATKLEDIIDECKISSAYGASITGGEPFLRFNKMVKIIRLLKDAFGDSFHIHLYTNGYFVTQNKIKQLYNVGLDEIRFHIFNKSTLKLMIYAKNMGISTGLEIPVIPNYSKQIQKIIETLDNNFIEFINLNELEVTETNYSSLVARGYKVDPRRLFTVQNSFDSAMKILEWSRKNTRFTAVHFCPIWVKDGVQLRNRYKNRAKNVAESFEKITEDGLISKIVIFTKNRYEDILDILKRHNVSKKYFKIDATNFQIFLHPDVFNEKLKNSLKKVGNILKVELIEETPTYERILMTSTPLIREELHEETLY